jgi:cobyrinic acid a,c-diamide synthase
MRGAVIAGTHSGCGKTTVTLGLLSALRKKGLHVQSFKAGPDFIDSGLHGMITGRHSRNLDLWMCGEEYVRSCYVRNSSDADISVVEGVMGLYDGALSTSTLASCLKLPVILVIDAYGMAETAGAIVNGFVSCGAGARKRRSGEAEGGYAGQQIAAVVFNRIASQGHFKRIKESVEGVPVVGYLSRELEFEIPHRHLGLTVAEEDPVSRESVDHLAEAVLRCIDIDMIVELTAKTTPSVTLPGNLTCKDKEGLPSARTDNPKIIAVAYDRAFCFYYEDNLDLLRTAGARIVKFSPLSDSGIPAGADAVYIGGGYPELHAGALSANVRMLGAIKEWADSGKPLYAECGGLMYLSRGIHDFDGTFFGMAGVFPFTTKMKEGRSKLGYREVSLKADCLLGRKGEVLRGHEFHYSEIAEAHPVPGISEIYSVKGGSDKAPHSEGYSHKNALASYIHIHFGSNPCIASEFVGHAGGKGK